jgi:hypothetical protein
MHYGRSNIIRNNILAQSGGGVVSAGRPDKSGPMTFEHNVMVASGVPIVMEGWMHERARFNHNLYWGERGKGPVFPGGLGFEQWKEKQKDAGSMVADPGFEKGMIKNVEAAKKVGFEPFKLDAGREKTAVRLPATQPVVEGFAKP